ncbi:MAG: wax ester/triacylglycerol synthase family O-acyltransferase [Ardenticatenaceae bacterium]|nr:wax ester/triacylglycerol synthase family O-acyltransferase [Anaerolineales bacterium]MCB8942023.1 wax ester/triacylglycerol synthase family O-acyltransferase [Ardenticatenaceae bacterium]MCB8973217.1 wax ester/triacylglycerol synthase family O-acyltransferase [Ardenticatenaceae bacterium]
MPKTHPLTTVDAAWLRMEDPTNLMMVSGIITFKKMVDFDHLKAVIEHKLLSFDRFRMRVVQSRLPFAPAYWEPDPTFNLNAHLHRVALPSPGDKATLQEMVSDLMSTPLDFAKPLWQFHLIENYGEGCAVMCRLHHCIADGMALVFVLLSLTDMMPGVPPPTGAGYSPAEEDETDQTSKMLNALVQQGAKAMSTVWETTSKVAAEGLEALVNPAHAMELALKGTDTALAAGRLFLRSPDPKTLFKGQLGVAKRAAWSKPIPLRDVKAIKNATGGTVNDVLVSAMTGSLRRYMLGRGANVEGLNFRAAVPVNLRTPEEMGDLGNKFGIVFLSLPIGIGDPLDRLHEVHKRMVELKNSKEAPVALGILSAMGMSPNELQGTLVNMFGSKTTAVMTNVPGPPMPLYLAGQEIEGLMFWVPQSGRVSLGISIISYANKVFLGVATDAGLVPDPNEIMDGFYAEFEALLELVREAEAVAAAETTKAASASVKTATAAPLSTGVSTHADQCQATTKSGRQCRNHPLDGSAYCRLHQP